MTEPLSREPGPALVDRSNRLRLRVNGPDRAKFLHNLTTNNVLALQPGQGAETFVTSHQGRTLGYATLHAGEQDILLRSDPAALDELKPHFEKYGIFDDVSWVDDTDNTFELHLFGRAAAEILARLGADDLPEVDHHHRFASIDGVPIQVIRESPTGDPGWSLVGPRDGLGSIESLLGRVGTELVRIEPDRFDVLRIEAGTPVFGQDVTSANLPQEIDRDDRAISFQKGCYLGQEPVARIDALGHVNKLLRGLQFGPGPVPPLGTSLVADGKVVGTVTSSGYSERLGVPVGLGLVRRSHSEPGQVIPLGGDESRAATVVSLPMRSGSS